MARQHPMVKKSKGALLSKTPSLASAKSLVLMRTLTWSLILRRRSSPAGGSSANPAQGRTHLQRTQVNHLLRKNSQPMKHSMTKPNKKLGSWIQISMPGSARRLLKASQAGHHCKQLFPLNSFVLVVCWFSCSFASKGCAGFWGIVVRGFAR